MSEYKKKDGTVSNYSYEKGNKIDKLCDQVNEKYNIKSRQIGSIERCTDMTTNKIVQICNNAGGYRDLMCGSEKQLTQFLRNILDGKVHLEVLVLR